MIYIHKAMTTELHVKNKRNMYQDVYRLPYKSLKALFWPAVYHKIGVLKLLQLFFIQSCSTCTQHKIHQRNLSPKLFLTLH